MNVIKMTDIKYEILYSLLDKIRESYPDSQAYVSVDGHIVFNTGYWLALYDTEILIQHHLPNHHHRVVITTLANPNYEEVVVKKVKVHCLGRTR